MRVYCRIIGCQNLVILKWLPLEYKAKSEKKSRLYLRPDKVILLHFLKDCTKKVFEDLQINNNSKFQTRATMSDKMATL